MRIFCALGVCSRTSGFDATKDARFDTSGDGNLNGDQGYSEVDAAYLTRDTMSSPPIVTAACPEPIFWVKAVSI